MSLAEVPQVIASRRTLQFLALTLTLTLGCEGTIAGLQPNPLDPRPPSPKSPRTAGPRASRTRPRSPASAASRPSSTSTPSAASSASTSPRTDHRTGEPHSRLRDHRRLDGDRELSRRGPDSKTRRAAATAAFANVSLHLWSRAPSGVADTACFPALRAGLRLRLPPAARCRRLDRYTTLAVTTATAANDPVGGCRGNRERVPAVAVLPLPRRDR